MSPEGKIKLEKHLSRFFEKDSKRRKLYEEIKNNGYSKAEMFRIIANGLGKPSTHCSGMEDGELKDT